MTRESSFSARVIRRNERVLDCPKYTGHPVLRLCGYGVCENILHLQRPQVDTAEDSALLMLPQILLSALLRLTILGDFKVSEVS